ncbi:hypothetical protein L0152_11195 [bacterium]|nr:hypothetical protein [bacterium]
MISRKIFQIFLVLFLVTELQSWAQSYWSRTFRGVNSEYGSTIQTTADGGYIVGGSSSSSGAGSFDAWVLKLDSSGSIQWQKAYGGATVNKEATSIEPTATVDISLPALVTGITVVLTIFGFSNWILLEISFGKKLMEASATIMCGRLKQRLMVDTSWAATRIRLAQEMLMPGF